MANNNKDQNKDDIIPVIDCSAGIFESRQAIVNAIRNVGFVYLTGFPMDPKLIQRIFNVGDLFWSLDQSVKDGFAVNTKDEVLSEGGYVAPGVETFQADKREIREAFNVTPLNSEEPFKDLPEDSVVPGFCDTMQEFFNKCHKLCLDILRAIADQINVPPDFFDKNHAKMGCEGNATTLRLLNYPAIPADQVSDGIIRLGEHSDYGSITLLFQDSAGGLEVLGRNGEWTKAKPIEGTLLINTGDLLQRWTNDELLATKHRVLLENIDRNRRSIVFFGHPDDDCEVKPLNGDSDNNKYEPITAKQHLVNMFSKTYA